MNIKIISPSDIAKSSTRIWWGDYWVQRDLQKAFYKRGYKIVKKHADIELYLFGDYKYFKLTDSPLKFCWVYSHPSSIIQKPKVWNNFCQHFNHIFVCSRSLNYKINNLTKNKSTSILLGASSKQFRPRTLCPKYDLIFVGNAAKPSRIELMKHLIKLNKYRICLIGSGWEKVLKNKIKAVDFKGSYIDNNSLGNIFNQGILSFYSSHEDMRQEGIVAVRILDIFKSSENLCIADENHGLKDMFQNIPTYSNKEELVNIIDWYLKHDNERKIKSESCRESAKQWTFDRIVTQIEQIITRHIY